MSHVFCLNKVRAAGSAVDVTPGYEINATAAVGLFLLYLYLLQQMFQIKVD